MEKRKFFRICLWLLVPGLMVAGILFYFYFFSPLDVGKPQVEAGTNQILLGWRDLSGGSPGKVVFARPPRLFVLDLVTGIEKEVPGVTVGGGRGRVRRGKTPRPSWSPDGKRFLYRHDGRLFLCDENGDRRDITTPAMDCSRETRWSWCRDRDRDWAVGPSRERNIILVDIVKPSTYRSVYTGGDVKEHCELTGTGEYIVFASSDYDPRGDVFAVPFGARSRLEGVKVSSGQSCRPCAAPDNRVAWLPIPHDRYRIHDAASGKEVGILHAPEGEEIYRLNWSNHPDFAVHMYGSKGNERMHVRRVSTGGSLYIGAGWDPDIWVGPSEKQQ